MFLHSKWLGSGKAVVCDANLVLLPDKIATHAVVDETRELMKFCSVSPSAIPSALRSVEMIAWVAHALLMVCLAARPWSRVLVAGDRSGTALLSN